jgi:hypothetical protein
MPQREYICVCRLTKYKRHTSIKSLIIEHNDVLHDRKISGPHSASVPDGRQICQLRWDDLLRGPIDQSQSAVDGIETFRIYQYATACSKYNPWGGSYLVIAVGGRSSSVIAC